MGNAESGLCGRDVCCDQTGKQQLRQKSTILVYPPNGKGISQQQVYAGGLHKANALHGEGHSGMIRSSSSHEPATKELNYGNQTANRFQAEHTDSVAESSTHLPAPGTEQNHRPKPIMPNGTIQIAAKRAASFEFTQQLAPTRGNRDQEDYTEQIGAHGVSQQVAPDSYSPDRNPGAEHYNMESKNHSMKNHDDISRQKLNGGLPTNHAVLPVKQDPISRLLQDSDTTGISIQSIQMYQDYNWIVGKPGKERESVKE
jgi:hypothetical protein